MAIKEFGALRGGRVAQLLVDTHVSLLWMGSLSANQRKR